MRTSVPLANETPALSTSGETSCLSTAKMKTETKSTYDSADALFTFRRAFVAGIPLTKIAHRPYMLSLRGWWRAVTLTFEGVGLGSSIKSAAAEIARSAGVGPP